MATNRNRYRRFRGNQKLARPIEAMRCGAISLVCLLTELVLMVLSALSAGDNPKWVGSVGTVAFVVAVVCFIYNIRQMKKNTDVILKWGSMAVSTVAFLGWAVVFFMGVW
ncbi:MAG: hypothetical protein HUJ98_09540 [Bacteroidaceae bacterium]|nr:hypothetical protein [Bacteroidaceae bacterium]